MITHSFFVFFPLASSLEGNKERSFSFARINVLVKLYSIIVIDEDVKVDESLDVYVFSVLSAKIELLVSNFEHKNHEELHQRGEKTFLFFYIHSQETFYNIMIFLQLRILETQKSFVLVMTFVLFVS